MTHSVSLPGRQRSLAFSRNEDAAELNLTSPMQDAALLYELALWLSFAGLRLGENFMTLSNLSKSLRRLGKWGALAVGFGGLFAADATAEKSELQALESGAGSSHQLDLRLNAVVMQLKGQTIYISQRGSAFEELSPRDSQHAAYLRKLLKDAGAAEHPVSVPIGSMIVANGGGAGDGKKPKVPDAGTASGKKQPSKEAKQPPTSKSGDGK